MMQRLRDQTNSSDATTARAAELLAAVPPLDAKRVRAWVRPVATFETSRRRPALGQLRTAVVATLTFASLAAAAATAERVGWIRIFGERTVSDDAARSLPAPRVAPPAVAPVASPVPAADPAAAVASSDVTPDVAPQRRVAPDRSIREQGQGGGVSGESVLMVQAVRALRRDGDPARAQALADEVLRRYPKGTQVEEAMALSMEAASAAGDPAGARRTAVRYLDRYPHGRFADRARRLVSGSKDGD